MEEVGYRNRVQLSFNEALDGLKREAVEKSRCDKSTIRYFIGMALMVVVSLYLLCFESLWSSVLCFLLLGLFQYYCLVATHEAFHYGLFKNRRINDFVGAIFAALNTFEYRAIKKSHLRHHAKYGGDEDPDLVHYDVVGKVNGFPALYFEAIFGPIKDFFQSFNMNHVKRKSEDVRSNLGIIILCHAVVAILLYFFTGIWGYFWYWCLPLILISGPLTRIRTIGEHAGLRERFQGEKVEQIRFARSLVVARSGITGCLLKIEKAIISPFNFNYHHEHHMLPTVPYYHLPDFHKKLKNVGYYDQFSEDLGESFLTTIRKEVIQRMSKGSLVAH